MTMLHPVRDQMVQSYRGWVYPVEISLAVDTLEAVPEIYSQSQVWTDKIASALSLTHVSLLLRITSRWADPEGPTHI